jgi:hypothetical protein
MRTGGIYPGAGGPSSERAERGPRRDGTRGRPERPIGLDFGATTIA